MYAFFAGYSITSKGFDDGTLERRIEHMINKWKKYCLSRKKLYPLFLLNCELSSLYGVAKEVGTVMIPNNLGIGTLNLGTYQFSKLYGDLQDKCLRLPDHDNHPMTNIEIHNHPFVHISWIMSCMMHRISIINHLLKCPIELWPYDDIKIKHYKLSQLIDILSNKPIIIYRMICKDYQMFDIFINNFMMNVIRYCYKYDIMHNKPLIISSKVCNSKIAKKKMIVVYQDCFISYIHGWIRGSIHSQKRNKLTQLHLQCLKKYVRLMIPISHDTDQHKNLFNLTTTDLLVNEFLSDKFERSKTKKDIECGNHLCRKKNCNGDFKICNGCGITFYCSKKCQKYDWNILGHRKLCDMTQDMRLNNALNEME